MFNKMKIGDYSIILLILIMSFVIFFVFKNNIEILNNSNKYAIITVNGEEIEKIEINSETNGLEMPIETEFGYNLLEFSDQGVRSVEASCPDKIDVLQGYITDPGEMIVCLPNRLVVEIVSEQNTNVDEVDVVN